jgi:hypothetical protein
MVFGAWLLSFVVSSFIFPLGTGVDANPDADDLFEQKGGCNIEMPSSWWKVIHRLSILHFCFYLSFCLLVGFEDLKGY